MVLNIINNYTFKLSSILKIFVCFLTIYSLPTTDSNEDSQRFPSFTKFLSKFHKNYNSTNQYIKRQSIYALNIQFIKNSNCTACGANYYTDWTQEQMQNLKKVKQSDKKDKIGAIGKNQQKVFRRVLTQTIPSTFDWRNLFNLTDVKNQGYCGASWAFSTVSFFQQISIINGAANSTIDLSQSYLVACNPQNQGCAAGYIESSIDKVIQRKGLPYEIKYPYNPDKTPATTICFENDLFPVENISRISHYHISDPQIIKQIIFKRPVIAAVCGVDLSYYFPTSNSTPTRTLHCKPQDRIIDHSVLLIGYTQTEWIVKNHWGKDWGINGYGYISRNPAEDCCIGDQIHTIGNITQTCSVQYCSTCVQNDTCYHCQTGRYVKHDLISGVQTCQLCTEPNCIECYNYRGTCKWCADGYALNFTTNKCQNVSIANCNTVISATLCSQCKPGYKLNTAHTACIAYCAVKNCLKCAIGVCTDCSIGFSPTNLVLNGKTTQYCLLNNCSVANCSLCNLTGSCVQCLSGFTLNAATALCTPNCTAITGCINCTGSTTCNQCVDGKSWNSTKKVCQEFNGTINCRVHKTSCTSCKTGYKLSSGKCIQTCDSSACSVCVKNDITLCITCATGYYLNKTTNINLTYSSVCVLNPCNITGCSLCNTDGSCAVCSTKYLTYNSTSNACQSHCNMENCRDCLNTTNVCDYCNLGYAVDYVTDSCVPTNISNCIMTYISSQAQLCYQCDTDYYLENSTNANCMIYCTDYYCVDCLDTSLYACTACFDGYFMYLVNGALTCTYIIPTMKGCDYISFNQSYCYQCLDFYALNTQTGACQLNTKNCPSMCEYCTTNDSSYFLCVCNSGAVFQFMSETCISNPLNDSNCIIVELYSGAYYCMQCKEGYLVNSNQTGCQSDCLVTGCALCQSGYNIYCWICKDGYYITSAQKCIQCNIANCSSCLTSEKCIQCSIGYQLDASGHHCTQIQCHPGFLFDGYECICPIATYYTTNGCQPCHQSNCIECSLTSCFYCESGYFLINQSKCQKCLSNCNVCTTSSLCTTCNNGFIFDQSTFQCINPASQGGSYFFSQGGVTLCPKDCLRCNNLAVCLQCSIGFVNLGSYCMGCTGNCKTCSPANLSSCLSCQTSYFLNQTSCVRCNDTNCFTCQISINVCTKCKQGFYLEGSQCHQCFTQNCEACNFKGQCTKCTSGYTLMNDYSCQQCGGNCRSCNSSAINQCYLTCNSTSYELNGACYLCPQNCSSCVSMTICTACGSGYILRSGLCKKLCNQGCYQCDQTNTDVCTQCLSGYVLTAVGVCDINVDCNQNQSCTACPTKWSLVNGSCEICNTDGICKQCQNGNINVCIQCQNGYFLTNSTCIACDAKCQQCFQLDRCQICKSGYYLTKNQVYGNCQPCDSMCKTCSDISTTCTSCNNGFELSVTDKCLRVQKINGTIELDIALSNFPSVSVQVRRGLIQLLGVDYINETKYYIINGLVQGSTILTFLVAIPQNQNPNATYDNFKNLLSTKTQVGGVPLISIKQVQLIVPVVNTTNNTNNSNSTTDRNSTNNNGTNSDSTTNQSTQSSTVNKLAIILGIVIPCGIILTAVIAFTFRRKLFKSNNIIENMPTQVLQQSKNQIVIHVRSKLPPIISVNDNTPMKIMQNDPYDMTNNKTYCNTTGLYQQQSYTRLQDPHEMSRVDNIHKLDGFDNTLQNIVSEINEGRLNDHNRIKPHDKISQFNQQFSQIRGSQHPINSILANQNFDELQFVDNTGRQLKENSAGQQSPSQTNIVTPIKITENPHLQIIQFNDDEGSDF